MSANVILIGMPGSGKSTLGKRLARELEYDFLDTDQLLERAARVDIQSIVNVRGLPYFRALEERVLSELEVQRTVIATGGSAVYSARAMEVLGQSGVRVYLRISLASMLQR